MPTNNKIDQKILDDYLAFFTTPQGASMVGYTYLHSSKLFNNLIKYSNDYYIFNDDSIAISSNTSKLKEYLSDVLDIVEIGPGCNHSLTHKTIHILKSAVNLKHYYAIDNFQVYLDNACNFIRQMVPGIDVLGIKIDLMQQADLKLTYTEKNKKCFLFLGSTLGNFDRQQQNHCLKQISHLTSSNDLFILTVDTNQDEASLLKAYNNKYSSNLIKGILRYFSKINSSFSKYLSSFEVNCEWNKSSNFVDMYFIAKKDLFFEFKKNLKIFIKKGQKLKGIRAYKYTEQYIIKLLNKNNFKVLEVFNQSDRMKLFICQKN